jgi:DUF4097 and DUF4098 domain-containing protein YvlB/polyhydroxyalkanoate synthesis regulator phasin
MSEERMLILKMLQEGKITAEEAARLLDAVREERQEAMGPNIVDDITRDIKHAVKDVVQAIPHESIDEVKQVIRETVREGRDAARHIRDWGREGWGWGWRVKSTVTGGHVATAPFEDVRTTSATRLQIRNTRGDLRLSRSTDGQLRIRATRKAWAADPTEAQRLADRLPIEIHESGDTITVEGPGARPHHERLRVDFDIAVPDTLEVESHLVRGDVTAEALQRDLAVSLVKGTVRVAECARVAIEGVSSDVHIQRSRGAVAVRVIRGDVKVAQPSGDIAAATKRGDIDIRVGSAGRLAASTVRGDVVVRARDFVSGGGADIHAVRGDLAVHLGTGARCSIAAATVSGDVSSTLPLLEASDDRHALRGVFNAPDAGVHLRTTRGDIHLALLEPEPVEPEAAPVG